MTIKAINRKEVGVTITQIPTGMRLLKQAGCGDPNALASLSLFGGSVFTGYAFATSKLEVNGRISEIVPYFLTLAHSWRETRQPLA